MTGAPFCPDCGDTHSRTELDLPALLDLLEACERDLDDRADYDLQGTPSQYVPNAAARLLHRVRVAKHSVALVMACQGVKP